MAEDEGKGVALVILGIVAIVAIIGLVMLFRGGVSGALHGTPGEDVVQSRVILPTDRPFTHQTGGGGSCTLSDDRRGFLTQARSFPPAGTNDFDCELQDSFNCCTGRPSSTGSGGGSGRVSCVPNTSFAWQTCSRGEEPCIDESFCIFPGPTCTGPCGSTCVKCSDFKDLDSCETHLVKSDSAGNLQACTWVG